MKATFTKKLLLACAAIFTLNLATAQDLIYSEDFSGAMGLPAGWTSADASGGAGAWAWCNDPGTTNNCITNWVAYSDQHEGNFQSTTGDNGYVFMDSDGLGSVSPDHVVQLTTGAIDFSAESEVWIAFESLIGVFGLDASTNAILRVSTDNATWTDYTAFEGLTTAERWSDNGQVSLINISDVAAGSATVYIQWQWTGNYEYYWLLDDVQVYNGDPSALFFLANDMQVNDNFFAIAANAVTPASQIEEINFLSDIENVGVQEQTNVNLNVSITDDGTSAVVHSEDLSYGAVPGFTDVQNVFFASGTGFTPSATPGTTYSGVYTITSDSIDGDPANDMQTFDFAISDTLFAKEMGATRTVAPADGNWETEGEAHSWAYGNNFYIVDGTELHARYATFGIANATDFAQELITVVLYKWDEDSNENGEMEFGERTKIATNIYEVTGMEATEDLITIPLFPFPGNVVGDIPLESDSYYVLMLEYVSADESALSFAASEAYDYSATNYVTDSLGVLNGTPNSTRYGAMLGINDILDDVAYGSVGFGLDIVPVVRLSVGESLDMIENVNELSDANIVKVSPNPASDYINLNLDLVEAQEDAIIRIMDATGKVVLSKAYDNLQNNTLEFNTSNYPAGSYMLNLITHGGTKTVRFVVAK